MRLRVSILRHRLPPTDILWSISEKQSREATTISRFLAQIDEIIPLEAEHWGLEDYVVTVDSFECLHFQTVKSVLKEGDHVVIRPLETPEVRARTASGRTQISENGQRLIDGLAFGRAYIRQPYRPQVNIPERKRRRVSDVDAEEFFELGENGQRLLLTNGESLDDQVQIFKRQKTSNSVRFTDPVDDSGLQHNEEEDDDEEDDEDFDPDAVASENEEEEENDDDEDANEIYGIEDIEGITVETQSTEILVQNSVPEAFGSEDELDESSDDSSDDSSDSSDSDSGSDSDSDSDAEDSEPDSEPDIQQLTPTKTQKSPKKAVNGKVSHATPGDSETPTKITSGKTKAQATEELTEAGAFSSTLGPSNATEVQEPVPPGYGKEATKRRNERRKLKRKAEKLADKAKLEEEAHEPYNQSGLSELEQKRQQLLESLQTDESTEPSPAEEPSPKRMRLDVASTRRLLFGSLGLKAPKTKEEELKLSEKLMTRYDRKPIPYDSKTDIEQTIEAAPDKDSQRSSWKSKIELSAVECVDDNVTLDTPPYPFVQRWDPQYQQGGEKWKTKPPSQATKSNKEASASDLPDLPADMSSLPELQPEHINVGAIVAYKSVECNESTNWTPTVTPYRTARIEKVVDTTHFEAILAKRDWERPELIYDDEGNRVLGRFEMPGTDDAEVQDDGFRELQLPEMMVPKLVRSSD